MVSLLPCSLKMLFPPSKPSTSFCLSTFCLEVVLSCSARQMEGPERLIYQALVNLFSVCLRSKRKMLGRSDSQEDRRCISSSSSSRPVTAAHSSLHSTRPAALKTQRRSESFKALLLRKGSRSDSSRLSAVERLRKDASVSLRGAPTPPPEQTHVKATSLSRPSDSFDVRAHLALDVPVSPSLCSQDYAMMFSLRQKDLTSNHLLLTSSSSPFFFLSSSIMRPRSLTPPCSASRRFAARCRLFAAPMTAIYEGECEEEEEEQEADKVFVDSPGSEGEAGQRLVEIP